MAAELTDEQIVRVADRLWEMGEISSMNTATAVTFARAILALAIQQANQGAEPVCARCQGSGEDPEGFYDQSKGPDGGTHDGPCRMCSGSGTAEMEKCKRCGGHGWVMLGYGETAGADACPVCVGGQDV